MKRKWKSLSVFLAALLCFSLICGMAGARNEPSFSLSVIDERPAVGEKISVSVQGSGLRDAYAYELRFTYPRERLRLVDARSEIEGFSVDPLEKDGELIFAHTKIGEKPGENGTKSLCTLTFEALAEGEASIQLTGAKLVDSKLNATELAGNAAAAVRISGKASPVVFRDIANHWAKAQIERAAGLGIVTGYPDGTFRPNGLVTRAEFAAMLIRALGMTTDASDAPDFRDDIPAWARPVVAKAAEAGLVAGYEDGTFRPGNRIMRAEMTVMIIRALGREPAPDGRTSFADRERIPAWAHPSVAEAVKLGLVRGRGGNRFVPNDHATRAEAVTLILAMLDQR